MSLNWFNEWHEVTQIEPAVPRVTVCGTRYERAYGRNGDEARTAYLVRTAFWVANFRRPDNLRQGEG